METFETLQNVERKYFNTNEKSKFSSNIETTLLGKNKWIYITK